MTNLMFYTCCLFLVLFFVDVFRLEIENFITEINTAIIYSCYLKYGIELDFVDVWSAPELNKYILENEEDYPGF